VVKSRRILIVVEIKDPVMLSCFSQFLYLILTAKDYWGGHVTDERVMGIYFPNCRKPPVRRSEAVAALMNKGRDGRA
jgi:hypothetical protein